MSEPAAAATPAKGFSPARIMQIVTHHFSNTDFIRTPAQLEREKWLIPKVVPFNRYFLMPAALAIQLCVGSLYAWSGYNLQIERAILGANVNKGTAVDRSLASITFYIAVAVFGCAAAVLGPWLERNGPFKGTLLGAVLFYIGNLLAGLAVYTKQMWLVYIGYGVIGGMGLGIGYISPVSPLQKFFPEMRGVAAGLAVCGFGGGSIIAPIVQNSLIGNTYAVDGVENIGVPLTFVTLGTIYFVVMVAAGLVLRMPPPGYEVKGITVNTIAGAEKLKNVAGPSTKVAIVIDDSKAKEETEEAKTEDATTEDAETEKRKSEDATEKNDEKAVLVEEPSSAAKDVFSLTLPQALLSREFRMMYAMFFASQITGLLSISKIQSIMTNQLGTKQDVAGYYNSGLSACNLLGRLILPTISDFVGRKPLFVLSLCVQAIFAGLIPTAIHERSFELVVTSFFIIGFFYGGGFGMIPAFLADQFSSKNVGATHGVILTSWSLTGVAGVLIFNNILIAENSRYGTSTPEGKANLIYVYDINFRWILGVVILGALICSIIPANLQIRMIPKVEGEIFRFRSYNGRMVRVMKPFKFVEVSKEQEQKEWDDYLAVVNPQ